MVQEPSVTLVELHTLVFWDCPYMTWQRNVTGCEHFYVLRTRLFTWEYL